MADFWQLSIVIPTCNRPELLGDAVASALNHTPENVEVLVINDGVGPVLEQPALAGFRAVRRLRVLNNTGARGAAGARNFGVSNAASNHILFLDDDDVFLPGYVRAVHDELLGNPSSVWGFCPVLAHAKPCAAQAGQIQSFGFKTLAGTIGKQHLTGLGCGFFIRRRAFLDVGGLNVHLRVNEDTEFCVRLLSKGWLPVVSTVPGVSILQANLGSPMQQGSTTLRASAAERAGYFRSIMTLHKEYLQTNPVLYRFLLKRHIKLIAKSGAFVTGCSTLREHRDWFLLPYFLLNWLAYRLK